LIDRLPTNQRKKKRPKNQRVEGKKDFGGLVLLAGAE
jgi:hypothetical protein